MKKIVLLLVCIFLVVSCGEKKENKNFPLSGTTWKSEITNSDGSTEVNIIKFKETTCDITVIETEDGKVYESGGPGTYTYTPPTVKITSNGETLTGTVQGNTLTLGGYTLKKQ